MLVAFAVVLALSAVVGWPVGLAAPPASKPYTASLSPATAVAGSSVSTTLRITNGTTTSEAEFGWVSVTVPSLFQVTSLATPVTVDAAGAPTGKSWTLTPTSGGFVLAASSSQDRLSGTESVTVAITGRAPCMAGTLEFTTDTAQANQGRSNGNRWLLSGSQPSLEVASACRLAILSVGGGLDPVVDTPFDVVVQLQAADGTPVVATTAVPIQLAVASGTGSLGTTSGTIQAGSSTATITTTYDTVENAVEMTASSPGAEPDSATFDVLAVRVTGTATRDAPLNTCSNATRQDPICVTVVVEGTSSTFSLSEQSCVLGANAICIGSLIEFLGSLGAGVATIQIEHDKTIAGPPSSLRLFYELVEGQGFVEAPDCVKPLRDGVVDPKPICVAARTGQFDGDRVIEAVFSEDIRLGTR